MPIGVADIIQAHPSIKYVIFLGALGLGGLPIEIFGVTFRIGEFIFAPFSWALNGLGIFITFETFYILMFVIMLVVFTLSMQGS